MTRLESAIITAYTGILCGPFDAFHKYAEQILGRPVYTHEFANAKTVNEIKEKSKHDFILLCESVD